ncbi:MAG TPA: DUF6582 domain-containing protein [Candidatus Limnocylindria bacterium]|nr:DUF6582 domain-containing protein [Candidatus Limnocylindria bacterium]
MSPRTATAPAAAAPLRLFVPITKVDVAKREVWGRAADETPDKDREVFDYASSKPHFEAWSGEIAKASDGKSLGNLRAMHQKIAAGKVIALNLDDAAKAVEIGTKVVDDAEWAKVEEGVYTGFSVGGGYAKRWTDPADAGLTRYTAVPSEISLADNPCNPAARFSLVKADGTAEERAFKVAEREGVNPKEGESKYGKGPFADETNKKYPIDTKAHAEAAWNYINKPKNAAKYSAADLKTIKGKIKAAAKKFGIEIAEEKKEDAKKAAVSAALRKGLYGVSCLAQLMEQVEYCAMDAEWEADFEGDDSDVPMRLHVWLADGLEILREMVQEETAELAAKHGQALEAAAAAGELRKKLSAAHQDRVQAIHDHAVGMGAECADEEDGMDGKTAGAGPLSKIEVPIQVAVPAEPLAKLAAELEALRGDLAKAADTNAALMKRVEQLEQQPAPPKGPVRELPGAVAKVEDAAPPLPAAPALDPKDPDYHVKLMKQAQASTGRVLKL